jgi:hypothetical protein
MTSEVIARRRMRGFDHSRIGPEVVITIPRDCSKAVALLVSRGLLAADWDDTGRGGQTFTAYSWVLQAYGVQTPEQLRAARGITKAPDARVIQSWLLLV